MKKGFITGSQGCIRYHIFRPLVTEIGPIGNNPAGHEVRVGKWENKLAIDVLDNCLVIPGSRF